MDKTKFLYATAGLDSEGFTIERYDHPLRATIESHMERICVTATRTELCGNSHCKDGCYVLAIQNLSNEALDAGLAGWKSEGVRIVGERRKVQR